jgi:hypothetical protein
LKILIEKPGNEAILEKRFTAIVLSLPCVAFLITCRLAVTPLYQAPQSTEIKPLKITFSWTGTTSGVQLRLFCLELHTIIYTS